MKTLQEAADQSWEALISYNECPTSDKLHELSQACAEAEIIATYHGAAINTPLGLFGSVTTLPAVEPSATVFARVQEVIK